jgi:hypothetical protein
MREHNADTLVSSPWARHALNADGQGKSVKRISKAKRHMFC